SSTQSVKFVIIDIDTKEIIWSWKESFDDDYYRERFGAVEGVLEHGYAPELHHTDPLMIACALERGMEKLSKEFRENGIPLAYIKAISGAGQQHGTVYYSNHANRALSFPVAAGKTLWESLCDEGALSRPTSPIGQDSTTSEEVALMDTAAGGPQALRKLTGSSATRRFSLAQIFAFFRRHKSAYDNTKQVLNIAAFNGSLLTGNVDFPFDPGDGAGTNAMDIHSRNWAFRFLAKLIPGLNAKLPEIKPSTHIVGTISEYWANKYGFVQGTKIVNWTGDNPSSLTGMGIVGKGQIVISLGTSYTMFNFVDDADLEKALEVPIGHVFGEPTGKYMSLICFQNGALTMEKKRDEYISDEDARARLAAGGNASPSAEDIDAMKWRIFEEEVAKAPAGNEGALMIPLHKTEDVVHIPLPEVPFTRNLDMNNRPAVLRAVVEGQAYFLKWVADKVGLDVKEIRLTGGVSKSKTVRRILADVFGANIDVLKVSDSVPLGSAIRAAKAELDARGIKIDWQDAVAGLTDVDLPQRTEPVAANVVVYRDMMPQFSELIDTAMASGKEDEAVSALKSKAAVTDKRVTLMIEKHIKQFGVQPEAVGIGPARINLLGEHTDYAGGHVLPIALKGVNVITSVSKRKDGEIYIYSPRFGLYIGRASSLKFMQPNPDEGKRYISDERHAWVR
ncbi:MAG: FGGY family carbohydrate kinase, partial [Candidatus Omnitrophota bacterium]